MIQRTTSFLKHKYILIKWNGFAISFPVSPLVLYRVGADDASHFYRYQQAPFFNERNNDILIILFHHHRRRWSVRLQFDE